MEKEVIYGEQERWGYTEEDGKIIINLDEVELDNEASSDTQLVYKRKERKPRVWSEVKEIDGFCPMSDGRVIWYANKHTTALTEKHAKAMIALAKISQLMPYYGGEVNEAEWADADTEKHYPLYNSWTKTITIMSGLMLKAYPAFHTKGQAEEFISYPENKRLLRDLYMIEDE